MERFGLDVDFATASHDLGAEKPSPRFFERLLEAVDAEPAEVAYVGDRVDNDVVPAAAAGMVAVHIRRGPWGHLQRGAEQAAFGSVAGRAAGRCSPVSELRVGIGVDAHAFSGAKPLVLGGVEFPGERGPRGPLGRRRPHARADRRTPRRRELGDIGTLFPSDDPTVGRRFLPRPPAPGLGQCSVAGWELVNADCVLIGERPRIAGHRAEMAGRLAAVLGVPVARRRAGDDHRPARLHRAGEGLAAQAVALLESE